MAVFALAMGVAAFQIYELFGAGGMCRMETLLVLHSQQVQKGLRHDKISVNLFWLQMAFGGLLTGGCTHFNPFSHNMYDL